MYSAIWITFVSRRALDCSGVSPARADADRSAYNSNKQYILSFIFMYSAICLTSVSRRALDCSGVSPARADADRSA